MVCGRVSGATKHRLHPSIYITRKIKASTGNYAYFFGYNANLLVNLFLPPIKFINWLSLFVGFLAEEKLATGKLSIVPKTTPNANVANK